MPVLRDLHSKNPKCSVMLRQTLLWSSLYPLHPVLPLDTTSAGLAPSSIQSRFMSFIHISKTIPVLYLLEAEQSSSCSFSSQERMLHSLHLCGSSLDSVCPHLFVLESLELDTVGSVVLSRGERPQSNCWQSCNTASSHLHSMCKVADGGTLPHQ